MIFEVQNHDLSGRSGYRIWMIDPYYNTPIATGLDDGDIQLILGEKQFRRFAKGQVQFRMGIKTFFQRLGNAPFNQ